MPASEDETVRAERGEPAAPNARVQARLDRRAEALRANLKRRKAQTRERAESAAPPSRPA